MGVGPVKLGWKPGGVGNLTLQTRAGLGKLEGLEADAGSLEARLVEAGLSLT
jgi:hypothetical protein